MYADASVSGGDVTTSGSMIVELVSCLNLGSWHVLVCSTRTTCICYKHNIKDISVELESLWSCKCIRILDKSNGAHHNKLQSTCAGKSNNFLTLSGRAPRNQ